MQTRAADITRQFFQTLETGDIDEVKHHLSGDFILQMGTAPPLNKYQLLTLLLTMQQSIRNLAFHIQTLQESTQYAQNTRIDAQVYITGSSTEGASLAVDEISCQAQFSFTIMGESIESITIADRTEGGFAHILTRFQSAIQNEEQAERSRRHNQQSLKAPRVPKEHVHEDEKTRYNRQSNLYDPQGKSYTPSRDTCYAPQVDTSIEQLPTHPSVYIFSNEQEQRERTRRQPERDAEMPE